MASVGGRRDFTDVKGVNCEAESDANANENAPEHGEGEVVGEDLR